MSGIKLPIFETERLILRGVELTDAPAYQKHFVDYEVVRQLSAKVPWPYPENGIVEFIRDFILPQQGDQRWVWGIFEKQNPNELIGVVDLWRAGIPENRGFWLGRKFWGRGYMTEAVIPVMDFAFDALGFEKLVLSNAVGNLGSHRVKEKTGARLVGTREAKFVDPSYTHAETWELPKEEWRKFRGQETPIKRRAARAVLLTPDSEVLMMKLNNKPMKWTGWITPGGGVEENESDQSALIRELHEELGLSNFQIEKQIWRRTHKLSWAGQLIEQSESYYLVRVEKFEPKPTLELNEFEKDAFEGMKWWRLDELNASDEIFAPRTLGIRVSKLLKEGVPSMPEFVW